MVGVVNCLLRGEAPESVRADFVGASLVALPKDESSHRPIAGGETLRRLTGKVAMDLVGKDASELLCPHQVGVGISGGAEALIHTGRGKRGRTFKRRAAPSLSVLSTHLAFIARLMALAGAATAFFAFIH